MKKRGRKGRFQYWSSDNEMLRDQLWFFQQVKAWTFYLPPGGQFGKHLRGYVPDAAKVSTPTGLQPIRDPRLISAALVAVYDDLFCTGKLILGQELSTIITAGDPRVDHSF